MGEAVVAVLSVNAYRFALDGMEKTLGVRVIRRG